ncbi:unnamed protein product, partial [Ectocarpus sp. 13 AM-2016]
MPTLLKRGHGISSLPSSPALPLLSHELSICFPRGLTTGGDALFGSHRIPSSVMEETNGVVVAEKNQCGVCIDDGKLLVPPPFPQCPPRVCAGDPCDVRHGLLLQCRGLLLIHVGSSVVGVWTPTRTNRSASSRLQPLSCSSSHFNIGPAAVFLPKLKPTSLPLVFWI